VSLAPKRDVNHTLVLGWPPKSRPFAIAKGVDRRDSRRSFGAGGRCACEAFSHLRGVEAVMTPLVIGVTSHRNIAAAEIEPIRARIRAFLAYLKREFPSLPLVVLSSLAEGGDQLFAAEALAAGSRLVVPLPLPREMYEDDFADPSVRA
jgi:hypothetical protein